MHFFRHRLPPSCLAIVLALFLPLACLRADYSGPVPAPTDNYGGPGRYSVAVDTFPSPGFPGNVVSVYRPVGVSDKRPTWFFGHGFGGIVPAVYDELLRHWASHGAVVVFSPYPVTSGGQPAEAYDIIFQGFSAAVDRFPSLIDTSRVGFAGHSYGGGAVPALALRGLREKGWGTSGLALYQMAPWYSFGVTDADLGSFPSYTQAVVQVYEADTINDHRMAIDIFTHLNLPGSQKDFLLVRSDQVDGYNYTADHTLPTGALNPRFGVFDALDAWATLRIAQALSASALEGDPAARDVALGNGSAAQVQMGVSPSGRSLRPQVETDSPVPVYRQLRYTWPFDAPRNPRRDSALPSPALPPRLSNVSARAYSAEGADVLIVGAVIQGPRPKDLLIRASGPALQRFGVQGTMPDPVLQTFRGATEDLAVDDWENSAGVDALIADTTAMNLFSLASGSKDAAILASFEPGALTAHARPKTGSGGVTLMELYDVEEDGASLLSNLSARAKVGVADNILIAGFIVNGPGNLKLLIRGVGPTLANFGVSGALADSVVEVYRGSERIAINDNWSSDPTNAEAVRTATAQIKAFPLPDGSRDSCLVLTLPAGGYTAQLRGANNQTGVGLIELYVVP